MKMIHCPVKGTKKECIAKLVEQSVQLLDSVEQACEAIQRQPEDAYDEISDIAQSVFGIDSIRQQQLSVIEAVLRRQDTVAFLLSPHR